MKQKIIYFPPLDQPLKLLASAAAFLLLLLACYAVLNNNQGTQSTGVKMTSAAATANISKSSKDIYAILAPAIVPSKTAECSTPITYNSNGTSGPLTCSNGDLNVLEWNALSALEPKVMTLSYGSTVAQIQAAMCTDANDSASDESTADSNLIESITYQISAAYYGWGFNPSPTTVLSNASC
jgi:hypothetical protein